MQWKVWVQGSLSTNWAPQYLQKNSEQEVQLLEKFRKVMEKGYLGSGVVKFLHNTLVYQRVSQKSELCMLHPSLG